MSALSSTLPNDLVGAVASFMNVKTLLRLSLTTHNIRSGFVWDRLRALDAVFDCNDGLELSALVDSGLYRAMGENIVRLIATLFERGVRFRSLQKVNLLTTEYLMTGLDALNPLLQHLATEGRLKSVSLWFFQLHLVHQEDIEELTVMCTSEGPLDWFQQPLPKLRSLHFACLDSGDDDEEELDSLIACLKILASEPKNTPVLERLSCRVQSLLSKTKAQNVLKHLAAICNSGTSKLNFIGINYELFDILGEDYPSTDLRGIPLRALRFISPYNEPMSVFPYHLSKVCKEFRPHSEFDIDARDPTRVRRHDAAVSRTEKLRDLIHGSFRSADYIDDLCNFAADYSVKFLDHEEWYIPECARIFEAWKADPFCSIDKILKLVVISASLLYQYRAFAQEYIDQSLKFLLEYAPVLIRELPERCCMDNADALSHTVLRDVILNLRHVFRTKITLRFLLTDAPLLRRLQLPHDLVATSFRLDSCKDTSSMLHIGVDPFVLLDLSLNLLPCQSTGFDWYQEMDYLFQAIENAPNKDVVDEKLAQIAPASDCAILRCVPAMVHFITNPTLEGFRYAVSIMRQM